MKNNKNFLRSLFFSVFILVCIAVQPLQSMDYVNRGMNRLTQNWKPVAGACLVLGVGYWLWSTHGQTGSQDDEKTLEDLNTFDEIESLRRVEKPKEEIIIPQIEFTIQQPGKFQITKNLDVSMHKKTLKHKALDPFDVKVEDPRKVSAHIIQSALRGYDIRSKIGSTFSVIDAVRDNNFKKVIFLVKHKANVNEKNDADMTPLHYAASNNNYDMVKFLIDNDADATALSNDLYQAACRSPLYYAIQYVYNGTDLGSEKIQEDNFKIIKLLIENRADINEMTGGSPMVYLAVSRGKLQVVEWLIAKGANVNLQHSEHRLIHIAAQNNNFSMVKLLVKLGAQINVSHSYDSKIRFLNGCEMPLDYAIRHKNTAMVHFFLENKACYNLSNKYGMTPLHRAVEVRSLDIVKLLVDAGAELSSSYGMLGTPYDMAQNQNTQEIVNYFKSKVMLN